MRPGKVWLITLLISTALTFYWLGYLWMQLLLGPIKEGLK
jgi:hypothetical protein